MDFREARDRLRGVVDPDLMKLKILQFVHPPFRRSFALSSLEPLAHTIEDQRDEADGSVHFDAYGQSMEHWTDFNLGFLHQEALLKVGQRQRIVINLANKKQFALQVDAEGVRQVAVKISLLTICTTSVFGLPW